MKTLTIFTIFVLISGIASTSLINNAYAQDDPDILLRIATQADKQIYNQLQNVYGDSIPSDIQSLYDKGHSAVKSLEESLPDDVEQAKQDFLTAMTSFKQITRMISEPVAEARLSTSSDVSDRDLKSELNRLHKYFQNLKAVSKTHNTGIEFSEIERLFAQARQQINSGESDIATETIQQLKSLIEAIEKNIREHASHSASDRAKAFAEKQLTKIKETLRLAEETNPDLPEIDEAHFLIEEIHSAISEDNLSDAKKNFAKLIKIMKMIEKSIR